MTTIMNLAKYTQHNIINYNIIVCYLHDNISEYSIVSEVRIILY